MDAVQAGRLVDMPLHAITENLGEDGLRARYALEIGRFEPADRSRLTSALGLASDLHRHDRRVREPYVNHLLRVAIRMMCHYEVRNVDVIAAGVLHDAVEDHSVELAGHRDAQPAGTTRTAASLGPGTTGGPDATGRPGTTGGADLAGARRPADHVQLALEALADQFGRRVADLVAAVTNPEFDPARDADEQYREHLATSLEHDPWARVIKVSDFTDNGVGVIHTTGPKALRAATKYRPIVPLLRDLVGRHDTPLSRWVKRHIFDQLDLAEQRFDDILGRRPTAG